MVGIYISSCDHLSIEVRRKTCGWRVFFSKVWLRRFFFRGLARPPPSRFLVTVIIFGLLDTKSVNCHRDRGGHGHHPRNCRRFSTLG